MTALLLRLEGPLQSWGIDSRYEQRTTRPEPSKSGVIGLLAAALGRSRDDDVSDLARLRFGVRSDRPGQLVRDYHTAREIVPAAGGKADRSVTSERYYLADASFLAGLEGDRQLLEQIEQALARPAVALALGRRSCPPSLPVHIPGGLLEETLDRALRGWPLSGDAGQRTPPGQLRLALECPLDQADHSQPDQPIGHAFRDRTFAPRGVRIQHIPAPVPENAANR